MTSSESADGQRPVLLVLADSLSYFGPKGGLAADHPRIWPNIVADELGWDVELVARIGWTCRDAWWALTQDPRVWAAVPRAGAVVFAVGGMDSLPSRCLPRSARPFATFGHPRFDAWCERVISGCSHGLHHWAARSRFRPS
ncbi:hypothetical protein GCM10020255_091140 [Rhodococcus baikonurensis]